MELGKKDGGKRGMHGRRGTRVVAAATGVRAWLSGRQRSMLLLSRASPQAAGRLRPPWDPPYPVASHWAAAATYSVAYSANMMAAPGYQPGS